MILKVVRGDYFPGLVNYIMRRGQYAAKGDMARVIRCVGLYNPITAAAELTMQASKAPTRQKRAVHFIGRAERMLTDEEYLRTAKKGLAAMGLSDRPFLLVVHEEDGGFHCATVEVDENGCAPPRRLVSSSLKREVTALEAATLPAGDVASRSWDSHIAWRLTKLARSLEIEFGLQQIGREHDSYDQISVPDWQLRREAEGGLAPLQEILGDEIKAALELPTWDERADALSLHGLGLRAYAGSNDKRRGLVIYAIGQPEHLCKGSSLGKAYGLGALEKRTGETIDCWSARHSSKGIEEQAQQIASNQTRPGGEALKSEFDALQDECLRTIEAAAEAARMHRQRMGRVRMIVALLSQRLLATGQICKSWARLICSLARAELQKKIMRLRALDQQALPARKRPPSWREFLKSQTTTNPVAQTLLNALGTHKRTKAASATTIGAREGMAVGASSDAASTQVITVDFAPIAASNTAPPPDTNLADEDAASKTVVDRLWHKIVEDDAADQAGKEEQLSSAIGGMNQAENYRSLARRDVTSSPPDNALTNDSGAGSSVRNRPRNPVRRALADAVNKRRDQPSAPAVGKVARDVPATELIVSEAAPNGFVGSGGVAPGRNLAQQLGRQHPKAEQQVQTTSDGTPPASSAHNESASSADIAQTHRAPANPQPTTPGSILRRPSSHYCGVQAPARSKPDRGKSIAAPSDKRSAAAPPKPVPLNHEAPNQEQAAPSPALRDQAREALARRKEQGLSTERVRSQGPSDGDDLIAAVHAARMGPGHGD